MLFIEYDVQPDGQIELVALINALEEHGEDPEGTAWLAWRSREFDDGGLGCVGVSPADLASMERAEDPEQLRVLVERIVLEDRADLGNIDAIEHGYSRGALSGATGSAAEREARRVIYREGNRQIGRFVRAIRLGPRRR